MSDIEVILNELKSTALDDPQTGWLSDLSSRDLEWIEHDQAIVIGEWDGSVDVGHLAGIVDSLIDTATKDLSPRLEQAEAAVARVREVATGDPTEYGWSEAMLAVLRALDGDGRA